jgi:hypothetical protein
MAGVPYLAGTYTAPAGGVNVPFGASIIADSKGQVQDNTNWSNLVAPIKIVKIFLGGGADPTQPGSAPHTPNGTMNAAITAGAAVLLMYSPAYAANSDGSGQPSAAQMQTDLTNILASLAALSAAGVNIVGVGLVNEPENSNEAVSTSKPQPPQYIALQQYAYSGLGPAYPFTATHASPCVFTVTGSATGGQPYSNGTPVVLTGASLPGGFAAGTTYWVVGSGASTFKLAATSGGSAINSTTTGSGTVSFAGYPFTATHASPCVFTAAGSSYVNGTPVFLTGGSLPGGFTAGTAYYVVGASGSTFKLAATSGGSAINSTTTGSGNVTYQGLHDAGWALCSVHDTGFSGHAVNDYFPGPSTVPINGVSYPTRPATADYQCADYYGGNYASGHYLSTWFDMAVACGMGIAITECGNSATGPPGPTQPQITSWISSSVPLSGDPASSMQAYLAQAKAAGVPVLGWIWFQNNTNATGPNLISNPTDFRIPLLQGLATSLSGLSATTGLSTSVGAGDTIYVGALATAGTVTGVTDTRGNSYALINSQTAQSGAKLFVFACRNSGKPGVAFTANHASPCVFTAPANTFALGDPVSLSGGSLPGGFTAGATYYVDNPNPTATTFNLSSANPLTATPSDVASTSSGSGTMTPLTALTAGTDIVTAAYSSLSSVQAVAVIGDHGVSTTDVSTGGSGNSTSMTTPTGALASQPENVISFWASAAAGGQPTVGAQLTKLAQVETAATAWLTVAWKNVTATASTNIVGTLSPGAAWSQVVATDPVAGSLQDAAAAVDALQIHGLVADVAGAVDTFSVQGTIGDAAAAVDALAVVNQSALVQQVAGSSTFDYGLSSVEMVTADGNTLVVLAGWDLSTTSTSAPMPAVYVTDSAGNYWYHAATTSSGVTGSRSAAWICPNAASISWLSVSATTFTSSLAYTVLELAGLPPYYSLDIADATANSSASTLMLSPGVTDGADFAFSVFTTGAITGAPPVPPGWVALTPVSAGGADPNPVQIFPYYATVAAGVSLAATYTIAQTVPVSGIVFAIHAAPLPPVQNNPGFPILKVEAGFGFTPGDPSQSPPLWTDITNRVIAPKGQAFITTVAGRQYELATAEAGTMEIWIDNHDGAFTPGNDASPYAPVVLETPVRVSAWWAGTWFALGYGYVERWPQEWPDLPQWGISKMIATDAISVLAAVTMSSALDGDILLDAPYVLIPASEQYTTFSGGINPTFAAADAQGNLAQNFSRVNQRAGMYVDGNAAATGGSGAAIAETGQATNLLGDADTGFGTGAITTAPTTPASGPGIIYTDMSLPSPATGSGVTVTFWLIIPAAAAAASLQPVVFTAYGPPSNYRTSHASLTAQVLNFTGSNTLKVTVADGSSVTVPFNPSTEAQQVTLVASAGSLAIYVNGALAATVGLTAAQITPWSAVALGCPNYAYQAGGLVTGNFTAFDLAIYAYPLPVQRIVSQYATGNSGQQNADATVRIAQILSWAGLGIPRAGRQTFNGASDGVLQGPAYSLSGANAADAVSQVAANHGALAAAAPGGALVYTHKWDLFNQFPVAIFGDDPNPVPGEVPYLQAASWDYDDTYLDNSEQVTQQYGANNLFTVTATDFGSQHSYFPRSAVAQTITTMSNLDAYDTANWKISKYSQPALRVAGVTIDAASNPQAAFPAVLGLMQGQVVTVTRQPAGGAEISEQVLVEKISHKIGPSLWQVSLQLSPYVPENAVVELDAPPFNTLGDNTLA